MMENESGFCLNCSHKHRGVAVCKYCDCNWDHKEDEPMARKIWEWVCWPFKKVWNWLKSCLPNG